MKDQDHRIKLHLRYNELRTGCVCLIITKVRRQDSRWKIESNYDTKGMDQTVAHNYSCLRVFLECVLYQ